MRTVWTVDLTGLAERGVNGDGQASGLGSEVHFLQWGVPLERKLKEKSLLPLRCLEAVQQGVGWSALGVQVSGLGWGTDMRTVCRGSLRTMGLAELTQEHS